MNNKALTTLEFNKITDKLSSLAVSTMGKEEALSLKPADSLLEITARQKETSEAVSMVIKKGSLPLGGLKDIRPYLKRVAVGGSLNVRELINTGDFLHVCGKVKAYSDDDIKSEGFPLLAPMFDGITPNPSLENEINRCVLSETEISDEASSALKDIRRNIKLSNAKIKEHLNSIIHSSAYKNMLQDPVVTIRNDRYCVPVKSEHKNAFPGMIHDQSGTGATVFMEPMTVVSLNNKIKDLISNEKDEIERILMRLSGMVDEHNDELAGNLEILGGLDFIFAKAELSLSMKGTEPVFNASGYINIKKGRHPLLDPDTVVPTDIYLGGDFTTLLITGPNTGGKTVSLKTLGLFTLMGQAGLHIPAFDNSELSVFDSVFADIGDEQSIEQSLSTFSSHMTNIVQILDEVTENSLVLLDELGSGTDPTEGAALAAAIISHLHGRGIRTAVTTHYSELKIYALGTEGVENASCEFDVVSLRPTFKLLIGIPGKSNAFAISRRLGLQEYIIEDAKRVLDMEDVKFEDVIADLEISKKTMVIEKERAEKFREEAERLKKDVEEQKQKIAARREKILLEAKEEARKILSDAKEESDKLIKEMQKLLRETGSQKQMDDMRQRIKERLETAEGELTHLKKPDLKLRKTPKHLKKGDRVYIHSLGQAGIVTDAPEGADVLVKVGIMKMKVPVSDLSQDETENTAPNHASNVSYSKTGKSETISPELDLRGFMVSDAIEKADKYLDDAYLSGVSTVTIIHGKGTGALRTAITNHLKNHPHVKNFRLGKFGEGETGVTIVEIR